MIMECYFYYNEDGCKTGLEPSEHEVVVQVPFCGTYGYLSDYLDGEMEREREYHEQEEDPREEIEYHFDLGQFCKDYVEWLADSLELKTLKFQDMPSPAYYNFETDKIWYIIDKSELWELYQKVKNIIQSIKEREQSWHKKSTHILRILLMRNSKSSVNSCIRQIPPPTALQEQRLLATTSKVFQLPGVLL